MNFPLLLFIVAIDRALGFKSSHLQQSNVPSQPGGGQNRRQNNGGPKRTQRRRKSTGVSIEQDGASVRLDASEDSSAEEETVYVSSSTSLADSVERRLAAKPTEIKEIEIGSTTTAEPAKAVTSTVNERLMSEIQASVDTTKYGDSKKREYFKEFRSQKTEEERQRSIEEAKDLNGGELSSRQTRTDSTLLLLFACCWKSPDSPLTHFPCGYCFPVNPLVCIGGATFSWACAGALWIFTQFLAQLFATHPLDTDIYFVQRLAQVFRNAVLGLSSLASGFFGVIGVGIFLLGLRVAYGVARGELDPTPIKKKAGEEVVIPDIWGLMMGQKPNRRGGRGGGNNPFGL